MSRNQLRAQLTQLRLPCEDSIAGVQTVQLIPQVLFWQHTPAPPAPLDPPAVATASSALSHGLARLIRVSTSAEGGIRAWLPKVKNT